MSTRPAGQGPLAPTEERELLGLCGLAGPAAWELMKGDGSERRFFRLRLAGGRSAVAIIAPPEGRAEAESYLYLAGHLRRAGAPVPQVFGALPEGRCILVEDLGDTHLEDVAGRLNGAEIEAAYRRILTLLAHVQVAAAEGLEGSRLYQGPRFDRTVMLEKESRYFFERYLNGCLGLGLAWEELEADFQALAGAACLPRSDRFLHRDFQSRNIMVHQGEFFFVDFQSGRFGPQAYDAASLLIDPYTGLPEALQERLLGHFQALTGEEPAAFRRGYLALALQRNLQILGAFSFLGLVRGKRGFLRHIPPALASLRRLLADPAAPELPRLRRLAAEEIAG
jgi:aminoglycoside/choline kinase family phosphotransferase